MFSIRSFIALSLAAALSWGGVPAWAGSGSLEKKRGHKPTIDSELLRGIGLRSKVQRPKASQRIHHPYQVELKAKTTLRAAPEANATKLKAWSAGERVTVLAEASAWLYVRRRIWRGWVPKDAAQAHPLKFGKGLPGVLREGVQLLSEPKAGGQSVVTLVKGSAVTILGAVKRFAHVKTSKGERGYVPRRAVRVGRAAAKK